MHTSTYTQSLSDAPSKFDGFIAQIKRFDPLLDLRFCSNDFSYHITHVDDQGTVYPITVVPLGSSDCINAEDFIKSINKFDYWNQSVNTLTDAHQEAEIERQRNMLKSGLDHSGLKEGLKRRAGLRINNAGMPVEGRVA